MDDVFLRARLRTPALRWHRMQELGNDISHTSAQILRSAVNMGLVACVLRTPSCSIVNLTCSAPAPA